MSVFVVDASVALAWCFEDEATNWTEEFLERLRQGDRIIVPAHWATEVANALLMGVRLHQILILNRSRKRSPHPHASDRILAGLLALLVRPTRLLRSAIVLKPSTLDTASPS